MSPVFGWLADKIGRTRTVLLGQALFTVSLLVTFFGSENQTLVLIALILLGLGWSAATVAGSTMVTESVPVQDRPGLQGTSDLVMNLCGAAGGAVAGPILAMVGFSGLGLVFLVAVLVVTFAALTGNRGGRVTL